MRTFAPLLGLALTACILQNPKFQDTESGGGSGSTSTGATATEGGSASASASTSGASASGTTTTDASTTDPSVSASATSEGSTSSSTGPATCDAPCPSCTACVDGECVPEDMGVACGDSLECGDLVAGVFMLDDGTIECRAFAPQQLKGRCDGGGACVPAKPSSCEGEGEVLAACDARCLQPIQVDCVEGGAAAEVDLTSLCVTEASIDTCPANCESQGQEWEVAGETCDALGHCVELTPDGCGDYSCNEGVGCLTSCDGDEDCAEMSECVDHKCIQN